MARIRTIKPDFQLSESMGKVSREARLLFILLWPICDDHGRARAASRVLASLLFPYDDDAILQIDKWIHELEGVGCIRRYEVEGNKYLEVCNWLKHQKIDRPSRVYFPAPREPSRGLDEGSCLDMDMDMDMDMDLKRPTLSANADRITPEPKVSIPYSSIVVAYNEALPMLPTVRVMTRTRRESIHARWHEDPERQDVAWWTRYWQHVATSDFLTGRSGKWTMCGIDWLLKPSNMAKVIEGNYDNPGA